MRCFLLSILFISTFCIAQNQRKVDFTHIKASIIPSLKSKTVQGIGSYTFLLNQPVDSVFIDAKNMDFDSVLLNEVLVPFTNKDGQLGIAAPKTLGKHSLILNFVTHPEQTVYFIGYDDEVSGNEQIWTQGQGKYTSHWLPSFDDMTEKVELDLTIQLDEGYQVISNGKLLNKNTENGVTSWHFDMVQPMSSYLAAFVVGDFDKQVLFSNSGVPIELYIDPLDSSRFEPTYRYTKRIFDFLEKEIGVSYPWQNYKQVPVQDFLYAGMENTGCTIFTNQYVIDSTAFVDKNYVNVNAHELAHQWFGNLVTEVSGEHHWLHEGFATYYAYLAEKNVFGDDHFYYKLYESAKTLRNLSENDDGEALTNPNAGSLTFYEKGAWALALLRETIGDEAFKKGVVNYLNTYAFKNVMIKDFLNEMETASGIDLSSFKENWLKNADFPWEAAKNYLQSKNSSLKILFELQHSVTNETIFNEDKLMWLWGNEMPTPFKRQLLFDYGGQIPDSSLLKILKHDSLKVRQAVAQVVPKISKQWQPEFEKLLDEPSYITQEVALFRLWQAFPKKRTEYLNKTSSVIGLPNKNVRLLWLTLALVTEDYRPNQKIDFYEELNSYTDSRYNFEIRQTAFGYLYQINALSETSLLSLVQACNHHVWQFKKTSRNLIKQMYAVSEWKNRLESIKPKMAEKEKQLLERIVKK